MPEMTPDLVLAKLARFTPAIVDPAELLFAAGRASARTPWVWKAAVAGSLLANAVCVGLLLFRSPESPQVTPSEPPAVPAVVPTVEPTPVVPASSTPDPWSYQAIHAAGDPDQLPKPVSQFEISHTGKPLSVLSARSGELD